MKTNRLDGPIVIAIALLMVLPLASASAGRKQPTKLRDLPAITLENISPPYKNYAYFKDHEKYPFHYRAQTFDLTNGWWLAEASALAYSDMEYARTRFQEAGLPQVQFFQGTSTQCYVAANDHFAVVAFRGSEIWEPGSEKDLQKITADLLVDIDIRLTPWAQGGQVHAGFKRALDEVWSDLQAHIKLLESAGRTIWFTGHSLGAALATLAAGRYAEAGGLYTFGSPRVGDAEFAEHFQRDAYRIVNGSDIVAHLPPRGPYRHVGEAWYLDGNGKLRNLSGPDPRKPGGEGERPATAGGSNGWIPEPIRDHVPLIYCIRLWNHMARNES
jgi:hypothetical protein